MYEPARAVDLRWPNGVIRIALSDSFAIESVAIKRGSDVRSALKRSLEAWEAAANVRFELVDSIEQNVSPAGPLGDGINLITIAGSAENILFFGKDLLGVPAATRIFYDKKGRVTEADIVLNPVEQFSTDGTFGTYDLESIFMHEIGHLLGLDHSDLPGATMFESVPKNGIFALPAFTARTLSEADRVLARAKYGTPENEVECCGSVSGRLLTNNGRSAANIDVWLENSDDGRVAAHTRTDGSGRYRIGGLYPGGYRVYASSSYSAKTAELFPPEDIAVELFSETRYSKRLASSADRTPILVGYNGQLSIVSIPVNGGARYRIYLGLPDSVSGDVTVESTSSVIFIEGESLIGHRDYDGLTVVSFEAEVAESAPAGEYSLRVRSPTLGTLYLPGALSIESFPNRGIRSGIRVE